MTYEEIYIKVMGHAPDKEYGVQGAFTWKDIESLMQEAVKNNAVLPLVSAMLPDLDIDKAEELAWETDYACFAVEEDGNEINKADAGAFFLEGYNYAKGNLR